MGLDDGPRGTHKATNLFTALGARAATDSKFSKHRTNKDIEII